MPLLLSFSLSLSLFFSLGAFLDTWFSWSPICLLTCLPCSLQVVSLIASPLLFFLFLLLGCFLYVSLNCCACLCVLWDETYYPLHSLNLGHYHMLPYLTSYLSPTCLLITSPLPCFFPGHQHFGTERRVFLLFPFFPYWLLVPLVFPNAFFASLLINYCCSLWVLLDPGLLILLVSHLCPCLFPLFSPSCILHSLPIAILLPGCFGKNGFPGLCFSLLAFLCGSLCDLGGNHTKPIIRYSVTFPYPGSLPYVTLLAFLLVPNLSPYHLSTTVLLSRSPAFGTEKRAFILFPFFHYLLL